MNRRWQSAAPPAAPSADDPDVRWLSYSQIAALRGISRASAERMVRKHRWQRTQNNHGVTVAAVPLDYAEPSAATPPEQAAAPSADRGVAEAFERALAAVEAARSAEASALRERAEVAETRADRADAAVAAERHRSDELRLRADHAQAEAVEARDQADRARAAAQDAQGRADAAQQALEIARAGGRWRRAWRAWRAKPTGEITTTPDSIYNKRVRRRARVLRMLGGAAFVVCLALTGLAGAAKEVSGVVLAGIAIAFVLTIIFMPLAARVLRQLKADEPT